MLSKRILAILLPCIGLGLAGCSLITNVDRTKIDNGNGGAGGEGGSAGENAGGAGGNTAATSSGGASTSSSS